MQILTPAQVRHLDQRTIGELGLPAALLMETAGRAIADVIAQRSGPGADRWAVVLAGVGNNGGDGFVAARVLAARGWRVECFVAGDVAKMSPETRLHWEAMKKVGGVEVRSVQGAPRGAELQGLRRSLGRAGAIVDALAGIGLVGELRDPVLTLASQLDGRYRGLTVAADIPSGICAETGRVLGAAVKCHVVVTMAAAKPGLLLGRGPDHWEQLVVADIGVPPAWLRAAAPSGLLLSDASVRPWLPAVAAGAHKGDFGHLFVVAGSPGKGGAALLCARAALRAGCGLVTLGTAGEIRQHLEGQEPDIMVEAIRGGASEIKRIEKLVQGKAALVVGPGLGTGAAEADLVGRLCAASQVPVVLDADALTALSQKPELAESARGRLVLTPHPGEMSRLLSKETAALELDRLATAREAAARFDAVVIYKGARTLIVAPDGRWAAANQPNPALAKAGTGDVLAGTVGAWLARGLDSFQAACVGVHLHAAAGRLLRQAWGDRGGVASDLADLVARATAQLQGGASPASAESEPL